MGARGENFQNPTAPRRPSRWAHPDRRRPDLLPGAGARPDRRARRDARRHPVLRTEVRHVRYGSVRPPLVGLDAAVRALIERLAKTEPRALDDGSLYDRIIGEVEKPLIEAMLARHGGNQLRAARAIGLNRNTLRKRLDVLGIDPLARPVTAIEE